jgi:hypothetical protein
LMSGLPYFTTSFTLQWDRKLTGLLRKRVLKSASSAAIIEVGIKLRNFIDTYSRRTRTRLAKP